MALAIGLMASAQVKIGDFPTQINAASLLELESSTQGVNFPKLALTSTAVAAPLAGGVHVAGMTVYNTNTLGDVTPGLYTNSGAAWVKLGGSTPLYQNIYGKVNTITSSYSSTVNDYTIISNSSAGLTITLTSLTVNDEGKMINIINNNTSATAITISAVLPNVLPFGTGLNQYRGRTYIWTGTMWLPISLN